MTEIQEQKIAHFFRVLDRNDNGILEEGDFTMVSDGLSDEMGHGKNSAARLTLKVKSYDLFLQILKDMGKHEASLTMEEWVEFFEKNVLLKSNNYIHQTSDYLFSLFDQDENGYINRKEYMDMFHAYGLYKANSAKAFDLIDLDGDEQISRQELIKAFVEFFQSSDPEAAGNWIFGHWNESV